MKKILLGLVLCVSLGSTACSKTHTENKEDPIIKQEKTNEEKYLTEEELKEVDKNNNKNINENIKYKFAKIKSVNDTKIEVEFVNTPKGYNPGLDVETSNLKTTGKTDSIDLIGVSTNFEDFNDLKEGKFIRIGVDETESGNSESALEDGRVMSVDII